MSGKHLPQYYQRNKQRLLPYYNSYYHENKERISVVKRLWRSLNPKKYLLANARKNAKVNNLEFNLTEEDIIIPTVCPALGIPLTTATGNDNSASIDRFDSSLGYTKDNINIISWRANNLKSNGKLEELEKVVLWMKHVEAQKKLQKRN